jgi:hypothetical protein
MSALFSRPASDRADFFLQNKTFPSSDEHFVKKLTAFLDLKYEK